MSNEFDFSRIPDELDLVIGNRNIIPNKVGMSGHYVYHLKNNDDADNLYLKIAYINHPDSLQREKDVLEWLSGKIPVPKVRYYKKHNSYEYLLLSEIKGEGSHHHTYNNDIKSVVDLLGKGMKIIHNVSIEGCPFDRRIEETIKEAEKRVSLGLVDEDEFLIKYSGITVGKLFDLLLSRMPAIRDKQENVFTHGDYCLPNIIINESGISGFIDWGRAGVSDPYQDIALAIRSLRFNWGDEFVKSMIRAYGIEELDWDKVEFYILLDEFF